MYIDTIVWEKLRVKLIDQTMLPGELKYIHCSKYEEIADAIKTMKIRGAPAIGIAGAMGLVLGAYKIKTTDIKNFIKEIETISDVLESTRPTAVNLKWALERMKELCYSHKQENVKKIKELLYTESQKILDEDIEMSKHIGKNGAALLKNESSVLTHCNAGGLATGGLGTALAVIYTYAESGKTIKVYADETRPVLQGARLTVWELMHNNIDVTLISDNMAGWLMKQQKIDCVIVGADRITANGDVANKIGTYSLSILAKEHNIPFYVAAPSSTLDLSIRSGDKIPIEERNIGEVTTPLGLQIAPANAKAYNPAFDVTPAKNVTAIITEKKVYFYPYKNLE